MYRIGDLVAYGGSGICRIAGITTPDMPGIDLDQPYYILEPLYQNCTIFTPVGANPVFMRPIITRNEAERLIDMIPSIPVKIYEDRAINEMEKHYSNLLKQYDCLALLKLTMSIYAKKQRTEQQKRKLGSVDERFMKQAEDLLFGELAAALEIPKDGVPRYIAGRVEGNTEGTKSEDRK